MTGDAAFNYCQSEKLEMAIFKRLLKTAKSDYSFHHASLFRTWLPLDGFS
jgi:hypothetical protein